VIVSAVTARLCVLLKLRTLQVHIHRSTLVVLLNDLGQQRRSVAGTCHSPPACTALHWGQSVSAITQTGVSGMVRIRQGETFERMLHL
jgi:hypothetical protein